MTKAWFLTIFLFLLSCKDSKTSNYDQRHALIANINSKDNLLTFSYWKDNDYAIKIEDLQNNKIIFSAKTQDISFTESKVNNGKVYFSESNHTFSCVDYKTGKNIWKISTEGRIRTFQIVNDSVIIASVDVYGLIAINTETGKIMYKLPLFSAPNCSVDFAPQSIGFDENNFYVSNFNCSLISAYEISSGKMVWSNKENSSTLSNFSIAGKCIFLGNNLNNNSEIILMEAETGKLLFKKDSSFDIFTKPIYYQNKFYYHSYNSELKEFDIEKKTTQTVFKFNKSDDIISTNIYQLDHFLYAQSVNYDVIKIDLNTRKKEIANKGKKGLLGVYKINGKAKFIY